MVVRVRLGWLEGEVDSSSSSVLTSYFVCLISKASSEGRKQTEEFGIVCKSGCWAWQDTILRLRAERGLFRTSGLPAVNRTVLMVDYQHVAPSPSKRNPRLGIDILVPDVMHYSCSDSPTPHLRHGSSIVLYSTEDFTWRILTLIFVWKKEYIRSFGS